MYFLIRPETQTYITIHKSDVKYFDEIINGNVFKTENKFKLIKDKSQIKQILEDRFSSKNRTSEYTTGLPSATLISSALFPYDLDSRSSHNKISLLRWNNDISVKDYQKQQTNTKLSTSTGTLIHAVIETALTDKTTRIFDKKKKLSEYVDKVINDKSTIKLTIGLDEDFFYFKSLLIKILTPFFENEIEKIDPVFCELFVKNELIQGAIDGVFYFNKQLYIYDWKTSKKANSQKMIFEKYARQLYIYSRMLLRNKIITQSEYENLGFKIGFFNWNSGRSAIYEYDKKEIDKSKNYVDFILSWYWSIKNNKEENIEL